MEIPQLVVIVLVVFVAAVFQASIGFGANVIAQPIVFLLDPSLVPGSILLNTALLNCLVMIRDRQAVQRQPMTGAVAGLLLGTTVGVIVIGATSTDVLALIIGASVLLTVALMATDWIKPEPTGRNIAIAAIASGFAGTTSGIGGPPMALVYQRADGPTARAALASFFLLATGAALTGLALAGRFGLTEISTGLTLFPATVLAFIVSRPLLPIVDRGATRPAILTASAVAGIILVTRTIVG